MAYSQIAAARPAASSPALGRFARLIRPVDDAALARMAAGAAAETRRRFGRAMRLFAPLYLSNECINSCSYCGFARENPIARVTLEIDEMVHEARHLASQGFRSLLLVAGEHPKFVSHGYLVRCIRELGIIFPSLALEVAPMETEDYRALARAGMEGLVVYQETYDRSVYADLHTAGPKKDYSWRLDCPERAYAAGVRRIGIGALFGLSPWREEALALAAHLDHLLRVCWQAQITVSLPRLRPAAGEFQPGHPVADRDLIQLVCAFRLAFPHIGLVLSTREPSALRDVLATLGITHMSAGSHTEPGGYTGQGRSRLHQTVRAKQIPVERTAAEAQFAISDERTPEEVAKRLQELGLDPVWKDWDAAILAAA